ncbi:bifunctional oligoribonuclease/PAP phosphatase NrnA [Planctomycetota bacterium]
MEISNLINQFLESIKQDDRILIMPHDNPDPDSIASAAALRYIVMQKTGKRPSIAYGGIIGRAENISMYKELDIKLHHDSDFHVEDYDRIALVDCQPEAGNSPVYNKKITISLTVDHHPKHKKEPNSDYLYLNDTMGATASIFTYYFMENQIELPKKLATALFYGIKSETQNLVREAGKVDKQAFQFLFPLIDNACLSRIENPERRIEYYHILGRAVERSLVYDDEVIVCDLGEVSVPDLIPQIADFILKLEGMLWSLVYGNVDDLVYVSLRTNNPDKAAHKVIKKIIQKDGTSGGHGMIAGGRIEGLGKSKTELEAIQLALKSRFLEALKCKSKRGNRMLAEKKPRRKPTMVAKVDNNNSKQKINTTREK